MNAAYNMVRVLPDDDNDVMSGAVRASLFADVHHVRRNTGVVMGIGDVRRYPFGCRVGGGSMSQVEAGLSTDFFQMSRRVAGGCPVSVGDRVLFNYIYTAVPDFVDDDGCVYIPMDEVYAKWDGGVLFPLNGMLIVSREEPGRGFVRVVQKSEPMLTSGLAVAESEPCRGHIEYEGAGDVRGLPSLLGCKVFFAPASAWRIEHDSFMKSGERSLLCLARRHVVGYEKRGKGEAGGV